MTETENQVSTSHGTSPQRSGSILVVCVLSSFMSAGAGFALQPMISRMLLPRLGGTASVWNTSVVFFQTVLLFGYALTHLTTTRLTLRWQLRFHLGLVVVGMIVLPIRVRSLGSVPIDGSPTPWLLASLLISVGLPYLALTSTSPLVQQAFTKAGHRRSGDPYFLYAASNIGSLLGLLAYPFVIEPALGLRAQARWWTVLYGLFALCLASLAWLLRHASRSPEASSEVDAVGAVAEESVAPATASTWRRRLRWIGLAGVPASISLAVTSYLATDVASVPLIWVLPLSLYLLSYVIAFGKRTVPASVRRTLVGLVIGAAAVTLLVDLQRIVLTAAIHLLVVFAVGLACHTRLGELRPPTQHLTEFYVALSLGGIVGGLFNVLVAPLIFSRVIEYPVLLVIAMLVIAGWPSRRSAWPLLAITMVVFGFAFARVIGPRNEEVDYGQIMVRFLGNHALDKRLMALIVGVVVAACALVRRAQLGAVLVAVLAVTAFRDATSGSILFRRNFYGAFHVDNNGEFRQIIHGTTTHGYQFVDPAKQGIVTSYYGPPGPLAKVIEHEAAKSPGRPRSFGVLGLGSGTIAGFLKPGDHLRYFEIDRDVQAVATNPKLFTFVSNAKGRVDVTIGDGRRSLARSDERFDLLVIDAFSSDAIPTHLLTREAVALYRARLRATGILAIHVSNRYLDLEPVVGAISRDLGLGAVGGHYAASDEDETAGITSSDWVFVMPKGDPRLGEFDAIEGFDPVRIKGSVRAWTDDRIDLLSVLMT